MFSLHGQVLMDPERFAGLSPALQTEAVLLMAECGARGGAIRAATGLSLAQLQAIGRARPRVAIAAPDRTERESEAWRGAPAKTGLRGLSENGRKILALLVESGGTLRAGIRTIEDRTGIAPYGGSCQTKRLLDAGLIEKLEAPHSTRATLWAITPEGRRVHAASEMGEAADA
jgi:DNA-binding MarR family transcriptional regulator